MGGSIFPVLASFSLLINPFITYLNPPISEVQDRELAVREMSLENRQSDRFTNDVFKDNILLNLAYMRGIAVQPQSVDWNEVRKPFSYTFKLSPNQTFAFHDSVLPEYEGKVTKTTNAHFNFQEGFKTDGYLFGDGVCHLASVINWVAKDANLKVYAPTSHDFAVVPGIEAKYGVSIYNQNGATVSNQLQNLYITNDHNKTVKFTFDYKNNILKVTSSEEI